VADAATSGGPVNPLADLYAVLEGSALIPFLESKLQANSFLEIGRHTAVYKMVIGIIRELAFQVRLPYGTLSATRDSDWHHWPCKTYSCHVCFCVQGSLVSLLGPLPDQTASIHSLLQNLESQARIMINRIGII
jgi:hypothetical protein